MDVQRKKGILEVCVLAVLKQGPSYGYLIIQELEQCVEISESTLYPILKRLEQNGSLTTYREEYNGRMRKYYQLTAEGQKKIDCFLSEWDELRRMYHFIDQQNSKMPQEPSVTTEKTVPAAETIAGSTVETTNAVEAAAEATKEAAKTSETAAEAMKEAAKAESQAKATEEAAVLGTQDMEHSENASQEGVEA